MIDAQSAIYILALICVFVILRVLQSEGINL